MNIVSLFGNIKHHWVIWIMAWRQRHQMDSIKRSSNELEFLPAALEIQESPPLAIGRLIIWTIILFFIVAIAWAAAGEVDIVATARGKIIPAGHSKVIQPLEIGKVVAIHVHEGQSVKQGDALLDLDTTNQKADQIRIESEWMSAKAGIVRIKALFKSLTKQDDTPDNYFLIPNNVSPTIIQIQKDLMHNQYDEYLAQIEALANEILKNQAESASIQANIVKLKKVIPLIEMRTASLKQLYEKNMGARNEYLILEQQRIEHIQDLTSFKSQLSKTQASIKQVQSQRNSQHAQFRKTLHTELAELETRIAVLEQDLIKAATRTGLQRITSPVDGVVQQLAVHTVGGVVTPAQELMVLVPDGNRLEVQAFIENKDIGFVDQGQRAEVKIDAFPFTKYGTINAKILHVSKDAIENEDIGWAFLSRVEIEQSTMNIEGKIVNLTPGMSVNVEIKTGKRRLIEYFLSPLLRYKQESVMER
jgi:hemolysin D